MGTHAELLTRHRKVMPAWQALYYEQPIAIDRGEGRHVWDAEGTRYLDWFGGILTTSTAHALPQVVDAVTAQAGRISHSSTLYLIEPAIELSELIADLAPIDDAKVFLATSGTEANELALLLATQARGSNQVLAMRNSYHGRSFGAMAITGNRGWRASTLAPFSVSWVEGGDPYRGAFGHLTGDDYIEACVRDLRRVIQTTTGGDVACLIAEPIQGVGGFSVPPDGLFGALQTVLDEYGILLIADEVQTGWGRTGDHFWGIDAHGARPDVMTFAKGLGNGLTIGGVVARPELMDGVASGSISTFGGNPLSAAGSLANLRYILDENLQANAKEQGTRIIGALREAAASGALPMVGDVRGRGLMFAVELVQPGTDVPDPAAATAVLERARELGLLIGKGGLNGNVVRMAPLLTTTADEAAEGTQLLLDAIAGTQKDLHGIEATALTSGAHA